MKQAEISKIIRKLEKIEKTNGIEVEDILKLLKKGDQTLIQPLKELSSRLGWNPINEKSFIPLAIWTDIVCIYFEFGLDGLQRLLLKKDLISALALGVLEELKTVEALDVILSIESKLDLKTKDEKEIEFIKKYTYSLSMISFNLERLSINDKSYIKLIDTLKSIIEFSEKVNKEVIRASSILCMGRLGRLSEIDYLKNQRLFDYPYKGLTKRMINNIQNAYR